MIKQRPSSFSITPFSVLCIILIGNVELLMVFGQPPPKHADVGNKPKDLPSIPHPHQSNPSSSSPSHPLNSHPKQPNELVVASKYGQNDMKISKDGVTVTLEDFPTGIVRGRFPFYLTPDPDKPVQYFEMKILKNSKSDVYDIYIGLTEKEDKYYGYYSNKGQIRIHINESKQSERQRYVGTGFGRGFDVNDIVGCGLYLHEGKNFYIFFTNYDAETGQTDPIGKLILNRRSNHVDEIKELYPEIFMTGKGILIKANFDENQLQEKITNFMEKLKQMVEMGNIMTGTY